MKKNILFVSICLLFFVVTKSQTEVKNTNNKYFVTMYNLTEKNFDLTKDFLGRFTQATSIEFNKVDSAFVIETSSKVNKQIVSGKMLKNYLPIKYFILDGEPVDPFPTLIITGNSEEDGLEYEKQKLDWIHKYPAEYKKMVSSSHK